MEFERAIFRVYERCMEGLRDEEGEGEGSNVNSKSCRILELFSLFSALTLLSFLIYMHVAFVGTAGCLPELLAIGKTNISSATLLKSDQILLINIDRSSFSSKYKKSNLRSSYGNDDTLDSVDKIYRPYNNKQMYNSHMLGSDIWSSSIPNIFRNNNINDTITNQTSPTDGNKKNSKTNSFNYDYEFSFEFGILFTPTNIKKKHNFETVNITLTGKCFGNGFTQSLLPVVGLDTIVMNFIMFTFKKTGFMLTSMGDYYYWSSRNIEPYNNFLEWLDFKVSMLINSLFSFFLMSAITSLLVRILISSGVVLLFPLFWLLQSFGMNAINLRIISLSYPWIGVPMEILRSRNQSTMPFIIAHISRVVVYYCIYAASQLAFSSWFYDRNSASQQELWLFAVMMIWEYYSMIYVRSSGSIFLFPKASLCLFLIYNFYYYSYPSGFHLFALLVMSLFLLFLMIFCIRVFEIKCFQLGIVNQDQPRAYYNSLPWPTWRAELAPEFTLFLPLTNRSINIYQDAVPNISRPADNANPIAANDANNQPSATSTSTTNATSSDNNSSNNSVSNPLVINSSNNNNNNNNNISTDNIEMNQLPSPSPFIEEEENDHKPFRKLPLSSSYSDSSNRNNQRNKTEYSRIVSSSLEDEDEEIDNNNEDSGNSNEIRNPMLNKKK